MKNHFEKSDATESPALKHWFTVGSRLEYLKTGKKLTRFGISKPMAVIQAAAARKRKRQVSRGSRGEETAHFPKRFASAADYEEVKYFKMYKKRGAAVFLLLG